MNTVWSDHKNKLKVVTVINIGNKIQIKFRIVAVFYSMRMEAKKYLTFIPKDLNTIPYYIKREIVEVTYPISGFDSSFKTYLAQG